MSDTSGSYSPPGLDLTRLRTYLDRVAPNLVVGPLRADVIAGGKSNLTYLLSDQRSEWVVRRPPLGHVLPTAHDMGREFRVMSALAPTTVPVPATVLLCQDIDVIGAPFYLMAKVDGVVIRTAADSSTMSCQDGERLAIALTDVLADLHDVEPASVGLADFGRPTGFLGRQIRRWKVQLDASRGRDLTGIDELHDRLAAAIPVTGAAGCAGIVHGDYRLDNLIVDPVDGGIAAVLDWEMATVGDPLTDLGLLLVYWDGLAALPGNPISTAIGPGTTFPPGAWLAQRYAERRHTDLSQLPWYIGFGFFKLAVIAEGIHARFLAGQTVGSGFVTMGDVVEPLIAMGHTALSGDYPITSTSLRPSPTGCSPPFRRGAHDGL